MSSLTLTGAGPAAAGPAAFSPLDLSPAVWLKADSLALSDGTAVSTWADQSGNSRDATQATAAQKPTYKAAIVNGKPVVRFDGVINNVNLPANSLDSLTAATVFIVVRNVNDPGTGNTEGLWTMGSSTPATFFPFSDGIIYDEFGSSDRKTTADPSASLSAAFHVYEVISSASQWTNFLDGTQLFTTATNTVGWSPGPRLGFATGSSKGYAGDIAEFVLYGSSLSAGNRSSVRGYLGTKYGITVS